MLKLAVERLRDWPKENSEYERLSCDLFSTFEHELVYFQKLSIITLYSNSVYVFL